MYITKKWKVWLSCLLLSSMLLSTAAYGDPAQDGALVTDDGTIRKQEVQYSTETVDFGEIVEAPYLAQTDMQLAKGQSEYLEIVSSEPYRAEFVSSKPSIATVNSNGKVTARKQGRCQIKVKINDEWFSCNVRVTKIAFTKSKITIAKNRKTQLYLTSSSAKRIKWKSTNTRVATVNSKGVVQGKKTGTCRIIAKTSAGTCSIKVIVDKTNAKNLQQTYSKNQKANQKKVMLIGSSSVDFWTSASSAFAPYGVVNMGIAGSKTTKWLKLYEQLVTDYHPSAVVIYVGSNDIRNGASVSGQENAANSMELIRRIREKSPKTPIFYVGICHVWSRKGGWNEVDISNKQMKAYCEAQSNVYYIDLASHMLDKKGLPDKSLFRSDKIHPNNKGYKVWNKYVAKPIVKILKKKK